MSQPKCLDDYGDGDCQGPVEYRYPLSSSNRAFPRCDYHWALRVEAQQRIDERYPHNAPSDFDPSYAGERWDEDY